MEIPKMVPEDKSSFSQTESKKNFWDGISAPQAAKLFSLALTAASITYATKVSVMGNNIKETTPYLVDAGVFAVVTAGIYAMEKLTNRVRSNRNNPKS